MVSLFNKLSELKEGFKRLFVSRKKIKALENYSHAVPFRHKDFLSLIKHCMQNGFLGDKEVEFLDYMVEQYEINFLDWCQRTKWVKAETGRIAKEMRKQKQYPLVDTAKYDGKLPLEVPIELIAHSQDKIIQQQVLR
jgi:hypothetical protein